MFSDMFQNVSAGTAFILSLFSILAAVAAWLLQVLTPEARQRRQMEILKLKYEIEQLRRHQDPAVASAVALLESEESEQTNAVVNALSRFLEPITGHSRNRARLELTKLRYEIGAMQHASGSQRLTLDAAATPSLLLRASLAGVGGVVPIGLTAVGNSGSIWTLDLLAMLVESVATLLVVALLSGIVGLAVAIVCRVLPAEYSQPLPLMLLGAAVGFIVLIVLGNPPPS